MAMKKPIIYYTPQGCCIRYHNRRLIIWDDENHPDGVNIEFQRPLEPGEKPETPCAGTQMVKGSRIKATYMPLSMESSMYLMWGIMAFNNLMALRKRIVEKPQEYDSEGHLKGINVGDMVVLKDGMVTKVTSDSDQYYPKWPWIKMEQGLPDPGVPVECKYDYGGVERNTYNGVRWEGPLEEGAKYVKWRLISPRRWLTYKDIDRFATWEEAFRWYQEHDELKYLLPNPDEDD